MCPRTALPAMAKKSGAARARPDTVIVRGIRRQRLTLIDVPQLSEKELRAVIRNHVCADLAWRELKRRGDAVRYYREVLRPQFERSDVSATDNGKGDV